MKNRPGLMKTGLREALRAGYLAARRHLLRINVPDVDGVGPFFPIDGSRHVGDPQHIADAVVLDAVENRLRDHLPTIRVVGEEAPRSLRPREYPVAVVDPIDGTKPYTHLGEAWAVVVLILEYCDDTQDLWIPAAGIVTSSGVLIGIYEEQTVTVELLEDETSAVTVVDVAPSGSRDLSIACVAAKASDWSRLLLLRSAFPDATLFNVGGNPAVLGVLTGDLDAIVAFEPQCNWDATYALAVALAGGTVGSLDGRIFERADVLSWFRKPLQGNEREIKTVPPIVAAKDRDTHAAIVAGLAGPQRETV